MSSSAMTTASASGRFRWDLVVFKVEDRLFKVNKHAFVEYSPVFSDMYLVGNSSTGEGTSDDRPILLEGHAAADFEALLTYTSIFSVTYFCARPQGLISGKFTLTKEQWVGVLRLSRPWEMHVIRKFAVETLSSQAFDLTPLDKVKLGRDHKVSSWLVEGLSALMAGEMELSSDALEEAIGLRTAFRIVNAQVKLRSLATVNTVIVGGVKRTGISLSALYCAYCTLPLIKSQFSCASCSTAVGRTVPGTGYIDGTVSPVTIIGSIGSCFYFNLKCIFCTACSQMMIPKSNFICQSCSRSALHDYNVHACHDPPPLADSSASTSIQATIRESFRDELQECDL